MELNLYDNANVYFRTQADLLCERVFDPEKYESLNNKSPGVTMLSHNNKDLIGFISMQSAGSHFNDFMKIIQISEYHDVCIPFIKNNEILGGLCNDIYISKMAISEKYRFHGLGSDMLNSSLKLFNKHSQFKCPRAWSFVLEDNPSHNFWLKNHFNFLGNYIIPVQAHNTQVLETVFYKNL